MTIKEIRNKTGLTQTGFGEMLNIPLRTIQNWENELRNPPDYVVELIMFKIKRIYKVAKRENDNEDNN